MNKLLQVVSILADFGMQSLLWAYAISSRIRRCSNDVIVTKLKKMKLLIIVLVSTLWSKIYCYFLDYLQIRFYPESNRLSG